MTDLLIASDTSNLVSILLNQCEGNPCAADLTGDGDLNFFDVSTFLPAFSKNCRSGVILIDQNSARNRIIKLAARQTRRVGPPNPELRKAAGFTGGFSVALAKTQARTVREHLVCLPLQISLIR